MLQSMVSRPGFWDDPERATRMVARLSELKAVVGPVEQLSKDIEDLRELMVLVDDEPDAVGEVARELARLEQVCDSLEVQRLLCRPHDEKNCYVSIHAGAGGTESCDWATMLLRMYTRFFDKEGYKYEQIDIVPGEEAGIRSVTVRVIGPYAFGRISCEVGVHRLVRISPFDAQARRHTSFAAVDCVPEFDEDVEVVVRDEDLRIDFFRASGAGGQHVNKVSSAVRITHIPTGIVVQCQNERSQHKNRAQAMRVLKGRLYMLEQQKRKAEVSKIYGEKGQIAWGYQIRSYVLQPYQMVKDHRTGYQTGDVQSVLDGQIGPFIDAYLRHRAKEGNCLCTTNKGKDGKVTRSTGKDQGD